MHFFQVTAYFFLPRNWSVFPKSAESSEVILRTLRNTLKWGYTWIIWYWTTSKSILMYQDYSLTFGKILMQLNENQVDFLMHSLRLRIRLGVNVQWTDSLPNVSPSSGKRLLFWLTGFVGLTFGHTCPSEYAALV